MIRQISYETEIHHYIEVIPPRCRKPRKQPAIAKINRQVTSCDSSDAPVVAITRKISEQKYEIRKFNGTLYKKDEMSTEKWKPFTRFNLSLAEPLKTCIAKLDAIDSSTLIINGYKWVPTEEPFYQISIRRASAFRDEFNGVYTTTQCQNSEGQRIALKNGYMPNARAFIASDIKGVKNAIKLIKVKFPSAFTHWEEIKIIDPSAFKLKPFVPDPALPPWKTMLLAEIEKIDSSIPFNHSAKTQVQEATDRVYDLFRLWEDRNDPRF